ncbi:GNAT family N-acetyltransferase [Lacibacter sp.]|uniref:GNAT family N-acetyltransferase n=1 Tax=Lacibacter sp. TaxID=1915409 RepID=UPI002B4B603D|nr:GNAT family N-acetyltransferase [Lacibacter sp.]HLP38939.1 GNAT family N-acetyltransferase [Lacibacter sp.]
MTKEQAKQIAALLNERNKLVKEYAPEDVLAKEQNYVYSDERSIIVACAESKKVQWYQWEICHVSVDKTYEGKGLGSKILKLAEKKAIEGGAKILQCTIRSNNESSLRLFLAKGYTKTTSFFYPNSGNWVHVLQKSVSVLE